MNKKERNKKAQMSWVPWIILAISVFLFIGLVSTAIYNLKERENFCEENGGVMVIEDYQLCSYFYNGMQVQYYMVKVTNKEAKKAFNYEHDYCFSCWDHLDCASEHNEILREKGVHC